MRKAVIDMGTNTFNLLIADVDDCSFNTIHSTKEPVLLGMGGINDNRIADDAIVRALVALKKFTKTCDTFGIDRKNIVAIGTSALRGAENANEFKARVKKVFDIDVQIISGHQEANLVFHGVELVHDFSSPAIIMDIGGGSTEFIFANSTGVDDVVTMDTGVSRIFDFLNRPNTFSEKDITRIFEFMDSNEQDMLSGFSSNLLIGASGSYKTFYQLIKEEPYPEQKMIALNTEELKQLLLTIMHSTLEFRTSNQWIIPLRRAMLPIVAAQVYWLIQKKKISEVIVSPYALKEGVMIKFL